MVANVETPEQAREIVKAVKYAPLGNRGVGLGGAHTDYLAPDPLAYFRESNENTTVICQIESAKGLANSEAIAAIEGVDVLWVGHFDLTQSMGIPAQFNNPQFIEALRSVVQAARKHGKAAGIQPGDFDQARLWMSLGYNAISWRTDVVAYRAAVTEAIADLRGVAKSASAGKQH
jgi:2-dehydro-3-deoxyglucarate aldolase/4-hydroxy-2-oxoheptanedioate aldolase